MRGALRIESWGLAALAAAAIIVSFGLAELVVPTTAQPGSMHNCPPAGKWSIAVWEGENQVDTGAAMATCRQPISAAYWLDPSTQAWLRWFADRLEVSNLTRLDDMMGVLALAASAPPNAETPTAVPPTASATLTATSTPIHTASQTPASTSTPHPTATPTPHPTSTPVPTATPVPTPRPLDLNFSGHCTRESYELEPLDFDLDAGPTTFTFHVEDVKAFNMPIQRVDPPPMPDDYWTVNVSLPDGDVVDVVREFDTPAGGYLINLPCGWIHLDSRWVGIGGDWSVRVQQ